MAVVGRYDLVFVAGMILWIGLLQCMTISNLWSSEFECYDDKESLKWFNQHNQRIQSYSGIALVLLGASLATVYVPANYLGSSVQAQDVDTVDVLSRHPMYSPLWPTIGVSHANFLVLICGVALAIGAMMLIRYLLLANKKLDDLVDRTGTGEGRDLCTSTDRRIKRVPPVLRWYWLAPLGIVVAVAGGALDSVSFFIVVALVIPLIVTASTAGLTYKEINAFNDMLDNAIQAIPWVNHRLFDPHEIGVICLDETFQICKG
jgi:hypothetical protein